MASEPHLDTDGKLFLPTWRAEPGLGPACRTCRHLSLQTESWEMPHIAWYECGARPANEHLPNFPMFKTCKLWKARKETDDGLRK